MIDIDSLLTDRRPTAEERFHAERLTGIGGSDIATLFGINPFSTRLQLYLEKRGELPPAPDTSRTRAGRAMEGVIAAMVAEREGTKLRRVNRMLRHPKYPWLIAHIDRDFVGEARGLEIKNVNPRLAPLWGKDGTADGIADYYVPQPHAYMLVLGYAAFEVAAFFGGDDLRCYPVERDPEIEEMIIAEANDFWHRHVLAGVPPEPDYQHPTTLPMLRRLYPGTDGTIVDADDTLRHWAEVAREADELAAQYAKTAEAARNHLLTSMGNAAILRLGDGQVFRRRLVERKGYTVEPNSYIDARFAKDK